MSVPPQPPQPPPYGSDPPPYGSDPPLPPPVGYPGAPPPPPGGYGPPQGPPQGYPGGYVPPFQGGQYGFDAMGRPLSDKSKLVAGLLQLFLGTFGIGRFYLGYTGLGVAMLLLSWLTCGIWPLIDAILILVGRVPDSQGRALRE